MIEKTWKGFVSSVIGLAIIVVAVIEYIGEDPISDFALIILIIIGLIMFFVRPTKIEQMITEKWKELHVPGLFKKRKGEDEEV